MCTIITLTRDLFNKNPADVVDRIHSDALMNGDGFALLLIDAKDHDHTLVRSMNVEVILATLQSAAWDRMFFHARSATTVNIGLAQCHGFQSENGWIVMHNGIVDNPRKFAVDSEHISHLIGQVGVKSALKYVQDNENFANIFLVNPDTGEFYVHRSTSGTLHRNEDGTAFSTKAFGDVQTTIEGGTFWHFKGYLVKKIKKYVAASWSSYGGGSATNWYDREIDSTKWNEPRSHGYDKAKVKLKHKKKRLASQIAADKLDAKIADIRESVMADREYYAGLPATVRDDLSKSERIYTDELGDEEVAYLNELNA